MLYQYQKPEHTFHIPVMGIAFTIDSPMKVARFGISSVISIVEDRLIELMRKYYYPQINQTYIPIPTHEEDYRAKRITDYLNLANTIVQRQVEKLKSEAFEIGSDIVAYFEMLPDDSNLKMLYQAMKQTTDKSSRLQQENFLREQVVAGSIDVNIMTKVDRDHRNKAGEIIADGSDAVAALRGYANSELSNSSIIFSAGLNPRLYNYLEKLHAFDPDENFQFKKKVIIKVSDYRSALIQGKYLAKKGIWVSEFRIESGLNCGGHAFATDGFLLGPIMEEFKQKRNELAAAMFDTYKTVIQKKLGFEFQIPPVIDITVQGGIGTHEEDQMLREYYEVARTGWGTPFLLVPEATTVDEHTLQLLQQAGENDVRLSKNSPLGVRFHYLNGTTSDIEKNDRILKGVPGSPCTEKHLAFNTEFSEEPICTASQKYQKLKLAQLKDLQLPTDEFEKQQKDILDKECLCIGLSNAAALSYDETFVKNFPSVNICPGPNIINFSEVVSLQTMTDHIYGRTNIMHNTQRPHMFIAELILYLNYIKEQVYESDLSEAKRRNYLQSFIQQLEEGITYYKNLPAELISRQDTFQQSLVQIENELKQIHLDEMVMA